MSHTMYGNLTLTSSRGSTYWWPLVFEIMRWHGFVFALPQGLHGKGNYIYFHYLPGNLETEAVSDSFKGLWDEIYAERGSVTVLFRTVDPEEAFAIEIYLLKKENPSEVDLSLALEGAELMSVPLELARNRLKRVIECVKTLYVLCQPCTGEIHWYHVADYAPWAALGKPLEPGSPEKPILRRGDERVATQTLPEGGYIHMLDPVPIPRTKGWEFISLL